MIIEQILRDVETLLKKYEYFSNIDLVLDETGEMAAAVEKAMSGQQGICIVIELAKGRVKSRDLGPKSIGMDVLLTVTEIPAINRDPQNPAATNKRATDVVEMLLCVLSAAAQVPVPCMADEFEQLSNMNGVVKWQVRATADAGWQKRAA